MNPSDDNGESLLQFIEKASKQELEAFLARARVAELGAQNPFVIDGVSTVSFFEIKTSSVSVRASISISDSRKAYSPGCALNSVVRFVTRAAKHL